MSVPRLNSPIAAPIASPKEIATCPRATNTSVKNEASQNVVANVRCGRLLSGICDRFSFVSERLLVKFARHPDHIDKPGNGSQYRAAHGERRRFVKFCIKPPAPERKNQDRRYQSCRNGICDPHFPVVLRLLA